MKSGLGYAALAGLLLGGIGGAVGEVWTAVISTAVLVTIFGAYNQTLKRNRGILGGVAAGGILGLFVSLPGLPISRNIDSTLDGALFGLLSGVIAGGVIGVITRARAQEEDRWATRIFLFVGSIVLGGFSRRWGGTRIRYYPGFDPDELVRRGCRCPGRGRCGRLFGILS